MANNHWKRDYAILWVGQAVSMLTSAVLQMALIWYLTAKTGSALVLSMASLAAFLPHAVLGMFAGTFVDRISRKAAMIGADLYIAAVSLALVIGGLSGDLPVWLIYAVLAFRSVGEAVHHPAISAATPLIVPAEELTRCAGYTQALQNVGYIAGTALAAVLFPIWSISAMVALDVFGAVAASIAVIAIEIPKVSKLPAGDSSLVRKGLFHEMKEGYDALKAHRGLFALLWTEFIFMVLYSPIGSLFPLMSLDYFNGTTFHASVAEITFSVGMLAGGIGVGLKGGFRHKGFGIVFSVLIMGAAIGISGILPENGFWIFAAMCVIMGLSVPIYSAPVTALMQEKIAPEYLGRVFGLTTSVCSMAMPIGLAVSGAFADMIGVAPWFAVTGILFVVLAAAMWMMPSIRHIDRE